VMDSWQVFGAFKTRHSPPIVWTPMARITPPYSLSLI
jgi:hypothetical protein